MNTMKTILLIEDETALRGVLRDELVQEGFSVLEAKNGSDGLKVALHSQPDLIILDVIMPVMDGMTMLKKLRQDPWGKDAKVIILTNLNEMGKISEAVAGKTYDYIIKSDIKLVELMAMVRQRLGM